jgi:hypothetical protein
MLLPNKVLQRTIISVATLPRCSRLNTTTLDRQSHGEDLVRTIRPI